MLFYHELKRRNVFRVGCLGITAWLIAQMAELADIKDDMAAQLQRAREMDVDGELAAIPADGR